MSQSDPEVSPPTDPTFQCARCLAGDHAYCEHPPEANGFHCHPCIPRAADRREQEGVEVSPEPRLHDGGDYTRNYYGVPAYVGTNVVFDGTPGVIVGFQGHYLRVRTAEWVHVCHPTWRMEYVS